MQRSPSYPRHRSNPSCAGNPRGLAAVIVEDDELAADLLATHLSRLGAEVVARADSVPAAAAALARGDYDVAFLDVQLGPQTSFELVPLVRPGAAVVFVTGSHDHATRAFEIDADDYIVKPVTQERLADALRRIGHTGARAGDRLAVTDRVLLRSSAGGEKFVAASEIVAVFSSENYSEVLAAGQRWFVRRPMESWETLLPAELFLRVHRTAIVNLSAVEGLERQGGNGPVVLLRGLRQPVRVSRSRLLALRVALLGRR